MVKIYKCSICGNILIKLEDKSEALACCGEKMELLEVKDKDGAFEKHVPVVEKEEIDGGFKVNVKVGSIMHPMEAEHFIHFVLVETENGYDIKFLKPGEEPEVNFLVNEDVKAVYEYCNLHGLWKA